MSDDRYPPPRTDAPTATPGIRPLAVLVGLPGSGKSTVGRMMADRLGVTFRDTDEDVERRTGRTVARIFADDGEPRFREWERAAVRAALTAHDGVLALGGGAVVDPVTRSWLAGGPVVHLDAEVREVLGRPGGTVDRPLLAGDPAARLRRLAARRAPFYREVARVTVTTRGLSAVEVTRTALLALVLDPVP
ncbi:shikimate kinase [Streptomyces ziwulingensis]|uniref:Shikimate kinase n=1 Tax=Streptomyces ziwulingensis TaxID=1045501 RepID=A0ABP9BXD5_9ACTN